MKKTLLFVAVILALIACATFIKPGPLPFPGVLTIEAQSLPISKTVAWDANAASDGVTNYVVRLDGTVIGSPTGTSQPFTITTAGAHTVAVRAVNLWGESVDATLAFNVVLAARPANVRIQ